MFRLGTVLAALALSFAFQVHAEEAAESSVRSEFFHQPEARRIEVTPSLGLDVMVVKLQGETAKRVKEADYETQTFSTQAAYGITDNFAAGAKLTLEYSKLSFKMADNAVGSLDDRYQRGLQDPTIFFNGRNDLPVGTIYYGLNVDLSFEHSRVNKDNNSNAASGGMSATPYLGYDITVGGRHTIGARVSYEAYMADRYTDSTDGVIKTTGGNTFTGAAFYEFTLNHYVSFGVTPMISVRGGTSSNRTSGTGGPTADDHNAYTAFILAAYVPYHVTENITLLGELYFGTLSNYNGPDVDSIGGAGGQFGARFAF